MGTKGRPTKHILTYEQQIWDNYNQYHPIKEATEKELLEHKKDVNLGRLKKAYTKLAQLAGYQEIPQSLITSISKKALNNV